ILIMMAILFFMFQFSQVIKARGNNYDVNEYAENDRASGHDRWEQPIKGRTDVYLKDREYVLFIGDATGIMGKTVRQWCLYTKRNLVVLPNCRRYSFSSECRPEIIFIDSDNIDFKNDAVSLVNIARENAQSIVFCNAPNITVLRLRRDLTRMVGVDDIITEEANIDGIDLFSGFFLGGEAIYSASETADGEELQDLPETIPWYSIGRATKTYMVGTMEDESIDKSDYPAIIWRNSFYDSQIYVVADDFMAGAAGYGILDAIAYEISDYQIYPVINARNTVIVDYPSFASENEEELTEIYSRSQTAVLRDIMWPGIAALAEKGNIKLTCYISPQYNYSDDIEPDGGNVVFYLQQFKETASEAGWSLKCSDDTELSVKFDSDTEFFDSLDSNYKYASVYTDELSDELMEKLSSDEALGDVTSIAIPYEEGEPVVSYYTDDITKQYIMADSVEYSYSKDFLTRSLITSLGYTNTMIDIHDVLWPDSEEDWWENYFDEVSSNVSTYWNMNEAFERTTMSESDRRVRNFLNLSYTDTRDGDTITLTKKNADEAWFVLRTHGEAIARIEGASYKEIEEDAYLIYISGDTAYIYLEKSDSVLEY
ncbi:MAG: DUF2194 domain-containing protein, partial [Lachnospiraceae bacterium]|nr:DUF2194 domain-containing protein [Lachnospiraceae bacterium]